MKSARPVSFPESGHNACFGLEDKSFWFRTRNKIIGHSIGQYVNSNSTFHDVGGGNGYVSKMIQNSLGLQVTMVEPGKIGCENARERGIKNIINDELSNVPSEVEIQNIGLFDVLEHIESPKTFLDFLKERLNKDGYIFITVPSYNFLWSGEDVYAGHFTRYNPGSIRKVLEASEFKVIEIVPFFFLLIFPVLFFRAIPFHLGLREKSKLTSDHSRGGVLERLISIGLELEFWMIKKGLRLPWGASLLVVAKKDTL